MKLKHVPNVLCVLRIVMIPVLWWLALAHLPGLFVLALAFTWSTDAVDGFIARKYHLQSVLGARLDSIADDLVYLSVLGWLYLLRPEMYTRYWHLITTVFLLFLVSVAVQYRRRAPLHTYANKFTAWLVGAFLLYTFLLGVSPVFTYITFIVVIYALTEGLLLLMFRRRVDETTRTIWIRPRPRPAAGTQ